MTHRRKYIDIILARRYACTTFAYASRAKFPLSRSQRTCQKDRLSWKNAASSRLSRRCGDATRDDKLWVALNPVRCEIRKYLCNTADWLNHLRIKISRDARFACAQIIAWTLRNCVDQYCLLNLYNSQLSKRYLSSICYAFFKCKLSPLPRMLKKKNWQLYINLKEKRLVSKVISWIWRKFACAREFLRFAFSAHVWYITLLIPRYYAPYVLENDKWGDVGAVSCMLACHCSVSSTCDYRWPRKPS